MIPDGLLLFLSYASLSVAQFSVYKPQQQVIFNGTSTSAVSPTASTYSGPAAFNPSVLVAPPVPTPGPATAFDVQLTTGQVPNLSIPQSGAFFGFSVEMSVVNDVCE